VTRPGPRLVGPCIVLTVLALAAPVMPIAALGAAAGLAALLAAALVEARLLRRTQVVVERMPVQALSLGELERVDVRLHVTQGGPLRARVRQTWPSLLAEADWSRDGLVLSSRPTTLALDVRGARRGRAEVRPLSVALTRWGLAEDVRDAGAATSLAVVPNLRNVRRLARKLRSHALRGIGARPSPRQGQGREFDRLRDYVRGDDLRDVAWKATARHGRLVTREWRLERSQDVLACIDHGHRMAARVEALTRLDHAADAAVLLGWACQAMEDRFGVLPFAARPGAVTPPARGTGQVRRVLDALTSLEAEPVHADYLALAADLRRRLKHRTLILVMTALPDGYREHDELLRAARLLLPRHLPLIVVLEDRALAARASTPPGDGDDLARMLVARDVAARHDMAVRALRDAGALVVVTPPQDSGTAAIDAYLDAKRRQLL